MSDLRQNKINNAIRHGVIMSFILGNLSEEDLRRVIYNPKNKEVFDNVQSKRIC